MQSFFRLSVALGLLASTVVAQYNIDPNSVSNATKDYWCTQQEAECPLICLQTSADSSSTESNSCDPTTLTYSCVCSNGLSPNISEYSQTLPYFICTEWGTQCVSNCGSDNTCASACRQDHPCGALDPVRQNTSTLTSMTSTTTTASGTGTATGATTTSDFTGFATGASSSGTSAAAHVRVWALSAGQTFGSLAVAAVFFGGFAVLL